MRDRNNKNELKPCPFCGKVPQFVRSYSKIRLDHTCDVIRINMSWDKKADLISKWNNRV